MTLTKFITVVVSIPIVVWLAYNQLFPYSADKEAAKLLNDLQNFPNGSHYIKVSSLEKTRNLSLMTINDSIIKTYTRIDESSSIMEAGREHFLYFGVNRNTLPRDSDIFVGQSQDEILAGLGVEFYNQNQAVAFDLSEANLIANQNDLLLYRIKMRSPSNICQAASNDGFGQCMSLPISTFGLTKNQKRSDLVPGVLNIACGNVCSQSGPCSASCSTCNQGQVAGADTPISRKYDLQSENTKIGFTYDTYTIKDRIRIWAGNSNTPLFDTGCVGQSGKVEFSSGNSSLLRVDVEPNCECTDPNGCTGTQWVFELSCKLTE